MMFKRLSVFPFNAGNTLHYTCPMRFADGPTTEASIEINSSPREVWELVSDIGTPVRFSDELQAVEWLDGVEAPAVGARFRGYNDSGAFQWQVTCTITDYREPELIEWTVEDVDNPVARWRFVVEPITGDEEGGAAPRTRLSQWTRLGPGPSGLTAAIERKPEAEERIIGRRLSMLRTNMEANLRGIKALVEGGGR
jgi:hypothetical protein